VAPELITDSDSDKYKTDDIQNNKDILSSNSDAGKIISQPPTATKRDRKPEKWLIQNYNGNNTATINIPVFCDVTKPKLRNKNTNYKTYCESLLRSFPRGHEI
jgi:hypothetical protein